LLSGKKNSQHRAIVSTIFNAYEDEDAVIFFDKITVSTRELFVRVQPFKLKSNTDT
jgi:hypothetical protein